MTRKKLLSICETLNVKFEKREFAYSLDSPDGYIFKSMGLHYADFISDGTFTMSEIYDELYEYIKDGIVKCDDPNCDICNN